MCITGRCRASSAFLRACGRATQRVRPARGQGRARGPVIALGHKQSGRGARLLSTPRHHQTSTAWNCIPEPAHATPIYAHEAGSGTHDAASTGEHCTGPQAGRGGSGSAPPQSRDSISGHRRYPFVTKHPRAGAGPPLVTHGMIPHSEMRTRSSIRQGFHDRPGPHIFGALFTTRQRLARARSSNRLGPRRSIGFLRRSDQVHRCTGQRFQSDHRRRYGAKG